MLVLTRRLGEAIIINENIVIRVIGVEKGKVRLGIEAPTEIPVDREEIHLRRMEFALHETAIANR